MNFTTRWKDSSLTPTLLYLTPTLLYFTPALLYFTPTVLQAGRAAAAKDILKGEVAKDDTKQKVLCVSKASSKTSSKASGKASSKASSKEKKGGCSR